MGTEGQGDEGTGLGTEGEGHGDMRNTRVREQRHRDGDTGTLGQRGTGLWGHRATRMGTQGHRDRGTDRTWE